MFRGSHITRVDEKGRLKLPADFKRQIDEEYGGQFYITSKDGETAEIYPMREWEKYEQKLAAVPNSNEAKQKLLRWLNYFGQTVEMDAAGRVLLPQLLREKAELIAEVVVSGNEWHLEVMNRTRYDVKLQPMTKGDFVELEKYGA
ncbi:MAG: division/cell wall cluster transcriptional repressor MraZ [Acidobacteriota bacterium]